MASGSYAIFELPSDWPGEKPPQSLVRIVNKDTVATVTPEELALIEPSILTEIKTNDTFDPDEWMELVTETFGELPDILSPKYRALNRQKKPEEIFCFWCEKPIHTDNRACPNCGRSLDAPACTRCGQPVSGDRDIFARYPSENGHYAWHSFWDGRCAACGLEYESTISLSSGHRGYSKIDEEMREDLISHHWTERGGKSVIKAGGGESVWMAYDEWDYQPTISITVKRSVAHNLEESGLKSEEKITLTPAEWKALRDEIEGPLRVLLERHPWRRDTT